jgi:hypothetical protein
MRALAVLLAVTVTVSLAAQAKDTGTIRGRAVRADNGEPLRRVRIRVEQVEAARAGSFPSTLTDDQGRYELNGLTPGRYYLRATRGGFVDVSYGQRRPFERGRPIEVSAGQVHESINFALPKGAVVAGRILVHLEGVDVTDTPIDFRNGDVNGVDVTLTSRLITLSGAVREPRGEIATDATVVVFADDETKWGPRSRFVSTARPDQQGQFTVEGLPPGRYLAIAVGYVEPGEEQNPEMLEQWRRSATSVTLSEGETRVLNLTMSNF